MAVKTHSSTKRCQFATCDDEALGEVYIQGTALKEMDKIKYVDHIRNEYVRQQTGKFLIISLITILKTNGPKTDLWGTLDIAVKLEDLKPLQFT